jgi:CubicO group peptidase (beta-lactamase class C family)
MKYHLILFLILLYSCDTAEYNPENINFDNKEYSEAFQLIDYWLEAQKDYEKLPGLTAVVTDKKETKWTGSFGFSDGVQPMRVENTFSICSISKLFTAVAIMQLVEDGKINLDDPIQKVLPWFDINNEFKDVPELTIKSILSHSSGLPRESNHPYWSWPDFPFPTKQDVIDELKNQEMLYPPSKYYQYSNLGLSLLGFIVEEVTQTNFDDYVNQNILIPLSMNNTKTYMSTEDYGKNLTLGYSSLNRNNEREKVNFFDADGIAAAAGFTSNVEDLAKFARWQIDLVKSLEKNILSPETLKLMHEIHWDDKLTSVTRGLGFGVYNFDGENWVGHGGSCPGYRSQLYINTNKELAYSVMINSSGTSPTKYIDGIHEILSNVTLKKGEEINRFEEFEGKYISQPWVSETYVQSWGDNLALVSLPSDDPYISLYKHIEGDVFKKILNNNDLGQELKIIRDDNNKVVAYKTHQNIYKKDLN